MATLETAAAPKEPAPAEAEQQAHQHREEAPALESSHSRCLPVEVEGDMFYESLEGAHIPQPTALHCNTAPMHAGFCVYVCMQCPGIGRMRRLPGGPLTRRASRPRSGATTPRRRA